MRTPLAACLVLALAAPAAAHFKLVAPESSTTQDSIGDPQKTRPCGGAGTASNMVTTVQTGSMLTVTINETVTHPGHYRVALAQTAAQLPADPPVTQVGNDQCGMTTIQNPPVFPVLADGMLPHNTSLGGTNQSFQVQLPAGMECTNCVLQVTQYMRNHGAPCFYYHCATVTISNRAPPPPPMVDAGPGPGVTPDAGTEPTSPGEVDGGCSTSGDASGAGLVLALGTFAFARRRRR